MEVSVFALKGFFVGDQSFLKTAEPPSVFFSYNWSHQELVTKLVFDTENALKIKAWQDIGQMGGGDSLLMTIYKGISESKLVVSCMSQNYIAESVDLI